MNAAESVLSARDPGENAKARDPLDARGPEHFASGRFDLSSAVNYSHALSALSGFASLYQTFPMLSIHKIVVRATMTSSTKIAGCLCYDAAQPDIDSVGEHPQYFRYTEASYRAGIEHEWVLEPSPGMALQVSPPSPHGVMPKLCLFSSSGGGVAYLHIYFSFKGRIVISKGQLN